MASKDEMLEVMLWLGPSAKDLLRDVSKTLRGAVPCAPAQLASALGDADICEGVLGSAAVRKSLAAEIKTLKGEVSDKSCAQVVEALGKVLSKETADIKQQAAAAKGKLQQPKKGMLGYKEAVGVQKDRTQIVANDVVVWTRTANAWDEKLVSKLPDAVSAERVALAASCPDGPIGEFATALHVLENIAEYIKWEKSLDGSKPPAAGVEVMHPFDEKTANEVAIRRTLTTALSPDVAMAVLGEVAGDASKVPKALQKLAADAKKQAVIPLYAAPPAPKEPKDKKAKKGEDAGSKDKAPAKPTGGKPAAAGPTVDAGSFNALHAATATQELQWHLLMYRLEPGTVLSKTSTAPSKAEAGKQPPAGKQPAAAKKGGAAAAATPKPAGFQGIWSIGGQGAPEIPPGHTTNSWASSVRPDAKFQSLWGVGSSLPPGHTATSWRSATSGGASSQPSKSEKAPAAKAEKASPKASPKTSPKAAPKDETGPVDEAAVKAVGDELRVLKEKLKSEGLAGKKLNDHPDVAALVAKMAALKAGAVAPKAAGSPKAKPAASPKTAPAAGPGGDDAIKAVGDEIRALKEKLKSEGITGKKLNDHPEVSALVKKLAALKA